MEKQVAECSGEQWKHAPQGTESYTGLQSQRMVTGSPTKAKVPAQALARDCSQQGGGWLGWRSTLRGGVPACPRVTPPHSRLACPSTLDLTPRETRSLTPRIIRRQSATWTMAISGDRAKQHQNQGQNNRDPGRTVIQTSIWEGQE